MKLFTRYLNSAAVFNPPDDKAAAEERKNIDVVVAHSEEDDNNQNQNNDDNKNKETDNEENDDNEEDEDDEEVDDKNKEKKDEETPEQKAAREKEERKAARVQRKFDKIAAEKKALEIENDKLKKQLEANPKEGLTEEEVERRATEKAKQIAAEEAFKTEQKEFAKRCDKLQADAAKIDPKIEDKITDMVEDLGRPVPVTLVNILADLDNGNGGSVLNYLADNVDEAEDIFDLSERRMTQSLIRISDKLKAEDDAKKGRERTRRNTNKDPADPIRPVNESGRNQITQLTGNESMDDFVRIRNAQDEARRKARNGGLS